MTTAIGLFLLIAAGALLLRVTAFAVKAALGIVALIGLLLVVVPLLIASS